MKWASSSTSVQYLTTSLLSSAIFLYNIKVPSNGQTGQLYILTYSNINKFCWKKWADQKCNNSNVCNKQSISSTSLWKQTIKTLIEISSKTNNSTVWKKSAHWLPLDLATHMNISTVGVFIYLNKTDHLLLLPNNLITCLKQNVWNDFIL